MTLEERMAMIDTKLDNDEKKRIEEKEKEARESAEYRAKIQELESRISDLLKFAWYAIDNGISLSGSQFETRHSYEKGFFFSNGWSHLVGIKNRDYLGITKGGACGCIDFYTNGHDTYGYNTSQKEIVPPLLSDMKRFLDRFDELEESLYGYVERKCAS